MNYLQFMNFKVQISRCGVNTLLIFNYFNNFVSKFKLLCGHEIKTKMHK